MPRGRFELKYLLTERVAQRVRAWAERYCEVDPNVPGGADEYTITSLYLDNPTLDLHWAKRTLQSVRLKARVRTYGRMCDGPVYVELKRRINDVMVKSRAKVPPAEWPRLLTPEGARLAQAWGRSPGKTRIIEDFRIQCCSLGLGPKVSVRYERVPLVGRYEPGVRVTFDRALRYLPVRDPVLPTDDRAYRPADFGEVFEAATSCVILELKFDDTYPLWMIDLVRRFELTRSSFSKYCVSVDLWLSENYTYDPALLRSGIA